MLATIEYFIAGSNWLCSVQSTLFQRQFINVLNRSAALRNYDINVVAALKTAI